MTPRQALERAFLAANRGMEVAMIGLASAPAFALRYRALLFALLAATVFYFPAITVGGEFLYSGDTLGWYLPALAKTHSLIHSLDFTALDFSSYNGSSDFFLSPNFFAYHPIVVLYALVMPVTSLRGLGNLLIALLALHTFLALYFTIRLFERYFAFEFGAAILVAVMFAFSPYMLHATFAQPPFIFCATVVPWVAYAALAYAEEPSLRGVLFASIPMVFGFTAGYLPLGVACLAMSAALVAVRLVVLDPLGTLELRLRRLFVAARPFVLALGVVFFYLYSIYAFHQETTASAVPSLFYSAHQLGELPQSVLRLFSSHFTVPGPFYEFSLAWGVIAITIGALFLFTPRAGLALPLADWQILKVAAVIYFVTVLAIYGTYSAVSDMVYYFIPQVGKMHIYQRFLLPAHLMFGVLVALMLKALVESRPPIASRIALGVLALATIGAAYAVAWHPASASASGLDNYIVFELGLGFLFACALTIPGRAFVFGIAAFLITLPSLDRIYDGSITSHELEKQKKAHIGINAESRSAFVSWLRKRFPERDLIKYVDITPMWTKGHGETFSKVFPFFVLQEVPLSSYGGFTFYLSARGDYMRRMPVQGDVEVRPDWEYVLNSGADFVVARASDLQTTALGAIVARIDKQEMYPLPNDAVAVPLRAAGTDRMSNDRRSFDNGYFRVSPSSSTQLPRKNLALGKTARQSGTAGGAASLAFDGNTNGDFAAGSVTHSARDLHAWLEVDLGASANIDALRIWNRTDCCGFRLRDYWIFISETPFEPTDTADKLRTRTGTWGRVHFMPNPSTTLETGGVRGRYVRLQFGGKQPEEESYLTVAELEVLQNDPAVLARAASAAPGALKIHEFLTDGAQWLKLDLEGPEPMTYLLWDNPRLSYYVDGRSTKTVERGGLRAIEVGPGRHTIEIQYRHWPLRIFWFFYGLYGIALLLAVVSMLPRRWRVTPNWKRMASRK